jgi:hypothetical protein
MGDESVLNLAQQGLPDQSGGLLGQFGGPTMLGLSMLAQNQYSPVRQPFGAILGRGALEAQQATMKNRFMRAQVSGMEQEQMLKRAQLIMMMRRMGLMGDAFGMGPSSGQTPQGGLPAPGGTPSATASDSGAPAAIPTGGAGTAAVSAPPPGPPAQSGQYTPMTEGQISQVAPPGVQNVAAARAYELSDLSKDPIEASEKFLAAQRAAAARQYAPVLAQIESINKADSPAKALQGSGNEQLLSIYPQLAAAAGVSGLNDRNVQLALTGLRNRLVAPFGQAAEAPPQRFAQVPYGVGGVANRDVNSGKVEAGHGEVETGQFVDSAGNIKLLPKSQGMAQGLQPFDASVYVNPDVSKQMGHLYASYAIPPPTGRRLTLQDMSNLQAAKAENPSFDSTKFSAKNAAMKSLAAGADGSMVTSMSTAVQHLNQLKGYLQALNNNDIQAINKYSNEIGTWFGSPVPPKVELVQNIAAEEINKIAVGGPGAEPDRELVREHTDMLKAAPGQASAVADAAIGIMGARINSIRTRVTSSLVGVGKDDFNTLLVPEAREALESHVGGNSSVKRNRAYNPQTGRIE